jgi:hypothetical protein
VSRDVADLSVHHLDLVVHGAPRAPTSTYALHVSRSCSNSLAVFCSRTFRGVSWPVPGGHAALWLHAALYRKRFEVFIAPAAAAEERGASNCFPRKTLTRRHNQQVPIQSLGVRRAASFRCHFSVFDSHPPPNLPQPQPQPAGAWLRAGPDPRNSQQRHVFVTRLIGVVAAAFVFDRVLQRHQQMLWPSNSLPPLTSSLWHRPADPLHCFVLFCFISYCHVWRFALCLFVGFAHLIFPSGSWSKTLLFYRQEAVRTALPHE